MYEVPIWRKYALTVEEAAEYFHIGEGKIREMLKEKDCNFVLRVGTRNLIKRACMERYLDNMYYL